MKTLNVVAIRIAQGWNTIVTRLRAANDNDLDDLAQIRVLGRDIVDALNRRSDELPTLQWLVSACIMSDIDDRDSIIRFLHRFATFSPRHIGWHISELTGDDPGEHAWYKGEDKRFRLHSSLAA